MKGHERGQGGLWGLLVTGALAALVAGGLGCKGGRGERGVLPVIELEGLDPAVAGLIRSSLGEVKSTPNSSEMWGRLGMVLKVYDYRDEARRCFAEARRLNDTDPRWPYLQALVLPPEHQEETVRLLRTSMDLAGDVDAPALRLAWLFAERGAWAEASGVFQSLVDSHPNHAPARLGLAQALHAKGDQEGCLAQLEYCRSDPHTRRAATVLAAAVQLRLGNASEARRLSLVSKGLPPDLEWFDPFEDETRQYHRGRRMLLERVPRLLQEGRLAEALPLIREILRRYPEASEGWLFLGRLHLIQKEFEEARTALTRHLRLEPNSMDGLVQMGVLHFQTGELEEAVRSFQRAILVKPDADFAHYQLGVTQLQFGEWESALRAFNDAIRLKPSFIEAYLMAAEVLTRMGKRSEAKEVLERAGEVNPSDPRVQARIERLGKP